MTGVLYKSGGKFYSCVRKLDFGKVFSDFAQMWYHLLGIGSGKVLVSPDIGNGCLLNSDSSVTRPVGCF